MANVSKVPLTPAVFYILLALSIKDRHGYDIMKQVESDSAGKVNMGPGTLYGSIKRMLEAELIREAEEKPDPKLDDERRKYYTITELGKKLLSKELTRYQNITDLARNKGITDSIS